MFCPNWVSVSNSLQTKCSVYWKIHLLWRNQSLCFTLPEWILIWDSTFVFLPMLSLQQYSGRWEGMQLSTEISACQTTSVQAVPTLTQFTFLTRLSVEWLWAGEFLMPFLLAVGSFPAYATEFMPDPLATSWPSLVSTLLQRLCSHQFGWTSRGLTLVWRQGEMWGTVRTRGSKPVYW